MKKVTVLFELESETVEQKSYLIDEGNVMYFDEFDNTLCLKGILPTEKEGIYKGDDRGCIILACYKKPVIDKIAEINRVIHIMKNMSLYHFIINHFDRSLDYDELNINNL